MFLKGHGATDGVYRACNQQSKQKSKYLKYELDPPLTKDNPTFQINSTFSWIDANQITNDKGLFISNNIRFVNGDGGYYGS